MKVKELLRKPDSVAPPVASEPFATVAAETNAHVVSVASVASKISSSGGRRSDSSRHSSICRRSSSKSRSHSSRSNCCCRCRSAGHSRNVIVCFDWLIWVDYQ